MTEPAERKPSYIVEVGRSILGDVRSYVVCLILGAIGIYFWPDKVQGSTYSIPVNVHGYALPLPGLLRNAAREAPAMSYRTDPEDLAQTLVCEATNITGENAHQLLVQYVDLYKDCFSLDEKSKTEIAIRPNTQSGVMRHDAGGWFCKCSNDVQSQPG